MTKSHAGKALLVVDVQNDFCPGGALAVPNGNTVVPLLNRLITRYNLWELMLFSRDWHPQVTKHFKDYGGIWPVHCVQHTLGAEFHPGLKILGMAYIISKGMNPEEDAYSPFQGEAYGCLTDEILRAHKITELYIGGLATDYCVKAAVLDALKLRYTVYLLFDACRVVNLKLTDEADALQEMQQAGAIFTTTNEILNESRA